MDLLLTDHTPDSQMLLNMEGEDRVKKWPGDVGKHLGGTHRKELLMWAFKKGSLSGCSRVTLKSRGR